MKTQTHIPKAFGGFLIISALIWLLINLSKEYTTTFDYSLLYDEVPLDKVLQEEPEKMVQLSVKGTGFKLLAENFSDREIKLATDKLLQKDRNLFFFLLNTQRVQIQNQLTSGLELQQTLKDTIYLKLGNLATKKVPVIPNTDITFSVGYDMSSDIQMLPDSILITGPELKLQEITKLETSVLKLENVSKNINQNVSVVLAEDNDKIKYSEDVVELSFSVDKFTEGEQEIAVKVINIPEGIELNTYPKTIKLVYKIGLQNFNKVDENSFEIECDYQQSTTNELSYLIPKLKIKPAFVSSVRMVPEKIDFLIHK